MTVSILVVEDNRDILDNVCDYLAMRGRRVSAASSGPEGLERVRSGSFDLVILDVGLPGLDGFTLCRMIRTEGFTMPVVMLTARDAVDDRVEGFECGADDYVVKPFSLRELAARVEAHLRRAGRGEDGMLRVGDLALDTRSMRVERAGREIKLNPTCFKLLRELMTRSPAVVGRARLERLLWGENVPESDSLRSNLYLLRAKIDKPFGRALLHTHTGLGWSIEDRGTSEGAAS